MAKLADKYAIGTEHVIDGITVIVEEADTQFPCRNCAFSFNICTIAACNLPSELKDGPITHFAVCYACERTDGKSVIFRRKEQQ